jgi:energy-coupling factor transporter ATP-binding protein EcfA2
VADALARLAGGGASILIAEQKTDLLAEICHRVIVVAEGAVALEGAAAGVLANPRLEELGVAPPAGVRLVRAADAAGLPPAQQARLREAAEA